MGNHGNLETDRSVFRVPNLNPFSSQWFPITGEKLVLLIPGAEAILELAQCFKTHFRSGKSAFIASMRPAVQTRVNKLFFPLGNLLR